MTTQKRLMLLGTLLVFASFAGLARAQTVLWSESFDDGNGNTRWYAENGVWQMGSPTIGPTVNAAGYRTHSGAHCGTTGLTGNYASRANSRLVRIQSFRVPDASQFPRLRFWHWYTFDYLVYGVVQVRTGGNTWQEVSPRYGESGGGWTHASIDLRAYASQTIQLAFQIVDPVGYPAPGWYVDDISLVTGAPAFYSPEDWEAGMGDWFAETGTWQVGSPTKANGAPANSLGFRTHSGTNCAVTLLNENYQAKAQSRLVSPAILVPSTNQYPRLRFWHWYSLDYLVYGVIQLKTGTSGWQDISPRFSGSSGDWTCASVDLAAFAGQTVHLAFRIVDPVGYPAPGWYVDDVAVVTGPPILNNPEGWETGLGDWYAETGTWQVGTPTKSNGAPRNPTGFQTHSGSSCAATLLKRDYQAGANSRFVSPVFTLPPADAGPYLRFWHWYSFEYLVYAVVQARVGTNAWQDISPHYTGNAGLYWTQPFADLTGFAGKTVQFAFQIVDPYGYSAPGWFVDDVQIYPYAIPVPADPPILPSIPNTNIIETLSWQYTPAFSGSGYSFGLSGAPQGMTVEVSTGTIQWTPDESQGPGTNSVDFLAFRDGTPVASTNFTVVVSEVNAPPVLHVPGQQTVYAASTLTLTNRATDSDWPANLLTFGIAAGSPSGVSIDPSTGVLTWTPSTAQVGTKTIWVTVTDHNPWAVTSQQLSVTNSFTVAVRGLTPPSITQQPVSLVVSGGDYASFCAGATGFPTPSYQWRFNGVNIPGATGACHEMRFTTPANIGRYDVVVYNSVGTNVSAPVSLAFSDIHMLAAVYLAGPLGSGYRIESCPAVGPTNWATLTNVILTTQPFVYVDFASETNRMRFYRAVPQ
jgi:hypothetical protein